MTSDFRKKQHEEQRLRHAIDYVEQATEGAKHLTTSELARLTRIILAKDDTAWRYEPAEVTIPTGKSQKFSVITNPMEIARRILGDAFDIVNNEDPKKGAIFAYLELVQEHLFKEGNRRTAALAAQWI